MLFTKFYIFNYLKKNVQSCIVISVRSLYHHVTSASHASIRRSDFLMFDTFIKHKSIYVIHTYINTYHLFPVTKQYMFIIKCKKYKQHFGKYETLEARREKKSPISSPSQYAVLACGAYIPSDFSAYIYFVDFYSQQNALLL